MPDLTLPGSDRRFTFGAPVTRAGYPIDRIQGELTYRLVVSIPLGLARMVTLRAAA